MYLKNQTFLVAGLSKSGYYATKFLLENGAKTYIFDEISNNSINDTIKELLELGAVNLTKEDLNNYIVQIDILVLSPGIPIDNFLPVAFKKLNKRVIGEMELAVNYIISPTVAITGTNGKTTIVSLIGHILTENNIKNNVCGNIGLPVTAIYKDSDINTINIIEVSSFQLETLNNLKPHIAVISNITPDHLNRHYNIDNYIFLKTKILQNLRESEFAILNFDDAVVKTLNEKTRGKVLYFSLKEKVDGCYLTENNIYYNNENIININELTLKGLHNIANSMVAIIVCKILNLTNEQIRQGLKNFKGVKHRIELIKEYNNIKFFNDSKGTNVDATIKAIECMENDTIILLGGKDKGYDYGALFEKIKNSKVVHAIIYGENRFKILDSAKNYNYFNFTLCNDLQCAVKIIKILMKEGQNILFSPASSSFDAFKNFEERGEVFVKLIEEICSEKNT